MLRIFLKFNKEVLENGLGFNQYLVCGGITDKKNSMRSVRQIGKEQEKGLEVIGGIGKIEWR